jgi:phosphoglycerate dehydrogenase-like enzyme
MENQLQIAVLDDYQNIALEQADWSALQAQAVVTVFTDHVAEDSALVQRLLAFDAVCVMRERTPLPRRILAALPRLKLVVSTGRRNASLARPPARNSALRFATPAT